MGPREGVSGAVRTSLYGLLQLFMLGLQLGKHTPATQIVLQLLENPKKSPYFAPNSAPFPSAALYDLVLPIQPHRKVEGFCLLLLTPSAACLSGAWV